MSYLVIFHELIPCCNILNAVGFCEFVFGYCAVTCQRVRQRAESKEQSAKSPVPYTLCSMPWAPSSMAYKRQQIHGWC